MKKLTYQQALDFLYSFIDYGSERSDRYSPDVFELARIRRFLEQLGDPHWQYPAIHIAGTKGKGSVAALIASTLQAAGYRTGLYTSPHLIDFTERIQINRRQITPAAVAEIISKLKPLTEHEPEITTYELMTALAFQHFAEQQIDIGVFEVGLGGRLDSTNVVKPIITVITSLSYDHTHLLGDTLAEIAAEKGGIIKSGVPVISAPQQPDAERVLQQIAQEKATFIEFIGRDWHYELERRTLAGQRFRVWREAAGNEIIDDMNLELALLGDHQLENGAVAYAALKGAQALDIDIAPEAFVQGFSRIQWQGRFQILQQEPAVIVDSAHNGNSAERLKEALRQYFPGRPVHLIFGASEDKDIEAMLGTLLPGTERATMTQADHPRAADPAQLAALAVQYHERVDSMVPVDKALRLALADASPDQVILVTGSLFTVGEVLAYWQQNTDTKTASIADEAI